MTSPMVAVARTELRLFRREPGSLFWIVAFPPMLVALIGMVPAFREPQDDLDRQRVVDLYVPVSILMAIVVASVQAMPPVVAAYREQGVLRRISTTPARARDVLAAQYLAHGAAIVVGAGLALLLGRVVHGVDLPGHIPAYLLVGVLAMAACLAAGGLIAGTAPNARVATAIGMTVFFPLLFTAGVWFPVRTMPDVLRDIVTSTPLGAAALGLESAALGEWPAGRHLAVMAGWTLGLGGLAVRCFRWDESTGSTDSDGGVWIEPRRWTR